MNSSTQWRIAGLAVGIALATAALIVPGEVLDHAVAVLGLERLTPRAAPPLGQSARLALAASALVFGGVLAWVLGRLFGRPAELEDEDAVFDPPLATAVSDMSGWRTPAQMAAPIAAPVGEEPIVAEVPVAEEPVIVATVPVAPAEEAPVADTTVPAPLERHEAPALSTEPPTPAPLPVDGAATGDAAARIEAALAALSQHGPIGVSNRFDSLDARLQQMAQQLAEIAGTVRALQRTPTPLISAQPAAPSARALPPPGDPALRHALAQAARNLRAGLGDRSDLA